LDAWLTDRVLACWRRYPNWFPPKTEEEVDAAEEAKVSGRCDMGLRSSVLKYRESTLP
jgi:hypothetical protein